MKYVTSIAACVLCLSGVSFAQSSKPAISPARITARERFGALGLQYSRESFLKQASEGDAIGVKVFLDAGMDPDVTNNDRDTALILAATDGSLETVQVLVKGGATVEKTGHEGDSPLIIAASRNHPAMVKFLLESGAKVNAQGHYHDSALIAGATYPAVVDVLLSYGADVDRDDGLAAIQAAGGLPRATFESLLKKAKISQDLLNRALVPAAYNSDPGVVEVLLNQGADVNARGNRETPLIGAAGNSNPAVAELLLAHGAQVNVQNPSGVSPILKATTAGNVELVQRLLEHGVDLSLSVNRKIMSEAIDNGNPSIVQLLVDHHAYLGPQNTYDLTPLMRALQKNNLAVFKTILKSGFDTADDKDHVLFEAVQRLQINFVEALLDSGANVNAARSNGFSVLMQAAKDGAYNIVRLLLSKGANVDAKTDKNETAQNWAEQANQSEIARLLADSGARK